MTGETLERVGDQQYRCTECGGESSTRLPNHEPTCPVILDDGEYAVDALSSFDQLDYGDTIEYVGPDEFDGETAVAPQDWKQPYTFRSLSVGGTLSCDTRFNGKKVLTPDHPANNPEYWRPVDSQEVSE
ncbi:hypothetical protein [Halorussus marinus]|uniref:hypothetical protein n=1 Tax=Halorussus marinus TaxID=2505976 RepID=UPI00106EB0E6|nr:hypothetical protein [Halorussus marinus]